MEEITVETFEELMFSGGKYIPAYIIFAKDESDIDFYEEWLEYREDGAEDYFRGRFERDFCLESDTVKRVKKADYFFCYGDDSATLKYNKAVPCLKENGFIVDGKLKVLSFEGYETLDGFKKHIDDFLAKRR